MHMHRRHFGLSIAAAALLAQQLRRRRRTPADHRQYQPEDCLGNLTTEPLARSPVEDRTVIKRQLTIFTAVRREPTLLPEVSLLAESATNSSRR